MMILSFPILGVLLIGVSNKQFLKPGDTVKVSGEILGEIETRIVESAF